MTRTGETMSIAPLSALPGVETFTLSPIGLGADLRISIARPLPDRVDAEAPSVVLYVTDADFCFGTVLEACRIGRFGGEVAPATVVGVGYVRETGDLAFTQQRRALDFYRGPPRTIDLPGAGPLPIGGADAFMTALLDTVAPEVERRVPTAKDADRVLFGMSAGGHFAAHMLVRKPAEFQGYALISPALMDFPPSPGACQMVDAVHDLPSGFIPEGTRVFLSAGSKEEDPADPVAGASIISNIYRMRAALAARGVQTNLTVFADETHLSGAAAAVSRALRFLAPPQSAST